VTDSFLAFLGVSILVIVAPGPDTALTIRNSLVGGRIGGLATALGVAIGQFVWALATGIGVVALLVASEPLFLALKYAGAAYLVFLGLQALAAAWRRPISAEEPANGSLARHSLRPAAALRQGVISNLGNPKMAVFFASLLPQFAGAGDAAFASLLLLGLVFCAMTLAWLAAYAALVASAGDVLRRPRIRRAIEGVTGILLIGLGLRLAADQR
jgi:threonine/homoserine/homoserine lactone efflux protein